MIISGESRVAGRVIPEMSSIRSCGLVLVALLQLVPAAQGTEQSVAVSLFH